MAKLHLITYGCQMNEYDSERVAGLLNAEQYELTDRADVSAGHEERFPPVGLEARGHEAGLKRS